ncbi:MULTISPECIES: pyridoxamine 5'-phosphate oxidase family protein [unclassified Sulfitobacter]|jgi:PPOX class probable FMN-dependent enzyme|uniref:pyridoxamine 5'-phosphate oxidase family protein n=1 Tax=unclassified Sulfitobacter TaxID=196795 RepID=UPI0007C2C904|nr:MULTISPECIES: pyridoxamine 5'-phosphate oxidase family protein [unclassified Sulfitobacter]KZY03405.1 pyridoxamine 5'-phosphate oxidase [Sulfitobacter sp. HI0023]KZY26403.1 pyridoxamine 5'-phosphate oxidase [Sulfitobacter sp. HI0040]KZZ62617.1 pyridoxamine 5'-phosphate oxidase [Sulfitobacter sp. HI0129]
MRRITRIADLEALYGTPPSAALRKVAHRLTPLYRQWIAASRLCIVSTVGPDGTDGSPRGDEVAVALELDPQTLALPDWHGNNRLDTLRNIVADPRLSLLFLVPGSNNVVRVNGRAFVTDDTDLRDRFRKEERRPATVIVVEIGEIYVQCARALLRARTWAGVDDSDGLPTVGQILAEMTDGAEGGAAYDANWGPRAAKTLW